MNTTFTNNTKININIKRDININIIIMISISIICNNNGDDDNNNVSINIIMSGSALQALGFVFLLSLRSLCPSPETKARLRRHVKARGWQKEGGPMVRPGGH